ncbi:MAG: hypothetical protein ACKPHU_31920, partial [Planctomycetaceae bacterium]
MAGLGTEVVEAAGAAFVLPDVVAGAGGVDFVVEVVVVAGFGTVVAEAADAGFVLPDVVAGAGGVGFVVEVVGVGAGF